jgi:hypothetical protein
MGSFSVSCGFSNLGINEGDATGLLILEKNRKHLTKDFPEAGKSIIVNATDHYRPLLPAVYGVYSDYGRIGGIKESVTTKILEEMFHRPIQAIVDCVLSDDEIYDADGAIAKHYSTTKLPTFMDRDDSVHDWLLKLGFTLLGDDEGNPVYTFSGYELFKHKGQTEWTVLQKQNERVLTTIPARYNLEDILNTFGHYTRTYPGFDSKDFQAVASLHRYSGMFFLEEVAQGMDKFHNTAHYMSNYQTTRTNEFKEAWGELIDNINEAKENGTDIYSAVYRCDGVEFFLREIAITSPDMDKFTLYGKDAKEIFELRSMIRTAEEANRPFGPSIYVSIGESDRASKMLNMLAAKVLAKRQQEWEEENFDPEEEPEEDNYWYLPEIS